MPFVASVRGNFTAAGKRPSFPATSSTGGTITTAGGYRIHTFTTVGTSTFNFIHGGGEGKPIEYLVIGGGASGGQHTTTNANAGGGAGGYQSGTLTLPTNITYTIDVGAGGASVGGASNGANGNDSRIATTSSSPVVNHVIVGGGGGGGYGTYGGTPGNNGTPNGGSGGGGGSAWSNNPGLRSGPPAVQAFPGGCCGYTWTGNGGGGAGSVGISGHGAPFGFPNDNAPVGNGGRGIASSITGTLVRRAGGGGGGGNSSERAGQGYDGGGRGYGSLTGQADSPAYAYNVWPAGFFGQSLETAGTPGSFGNQCMPGLNNTGGGGGAGSYWQANAGAPSVISGAGGSGIVVIRYLL